MNWKTHIPVEIWHNCWNDLPSSDLLALNQTCSLFRDICRPLLFRFIFHLPTAEVLAMNDTITDEEFKKWETRTIRFEDQMKWLLSDPTFARFPRFCMFSGLPPTDLLYLGSQHASGPPIYETMLSAFKASMPLMKNLRVIRLEDIDIDEELLNALVQLPLLKDLRLQSMDLACRSISPLVDVEELSIMEWELKTEYTPQPLQLFSNKRLRNIEIQSYQCASPILEHFLKQGTSELLTTLRIAVDIKVIPALMAFLETCPQLTTLSASNILPEVFPVYPPLSLSALPRLHTYHGIGSLASVIIPNRPVKHITIVDNWRSSGFHGDGFASALSQLVKSSAMVEHLSLPPLLPQPDIFHALANTFPKLRSLELHFPLIDTDVSEIPDEDSALDDKFFDLTTVNEIPPIDVDHQGSPIKSPTTIRGVLDWLCLNKLPLSSSITELSILHQNPRTRGINHMFKTYLSFREQYHVVGMLSTHFPALKSMTFGRRHIQWEYGTDGKWKPGAAYYNLFLLRRSVVPRIPPNTTPVDH